MNSNKISIKDLVPNDLKTEIDQKIFFDQWRLYLEMADKIGQRRGSTNNFFLSINSLILAAFAIIIEQQIILGILPLIFLGLVMTIIWRNLILYYRNLSKIKFQIINLLEQKLPARGYIVEWETLRKKNGEEEFWSASRLELLIPISLIGFYLLASGWIILFILKIV